MDFDSLALRSVFQVPLLGHWHIMGMVHPSRAAMEKDKEPNRVARPKKSQVYIGHERIEILWQFETVLLINAIAKNIIATDSVFSRATDRGEDGLMVASQSRRQGGWDTVRRLSGSDHERGVSSSSKAGNRMLVKAQWPDFSRRLTTPPCHLLAHRTQLDDAQDLVGKVEATVCVVENLDWRVGSHGIGTSSRS